MKLRALWVGPPPRTGDFIMSQMRPRYAYRVEEVINASSRVSWDPAAKAEVRRLQIVADRVARDAVPPHARVHPWKWDRREAARRRT
jgi:hypothetical protein